MRERIVAFLAVFAFRFLFSAYWINSRPDEYYKPDGVWEKIEAVCSFTGIRTKAVCENERL